MGAEIAVKCEVIKSHRTLDIKNKDIGSREIDADIVDIDQLKKEYEYQQEDTLMQRYFKSYQVSTDGHKGYSL
jgi:predicted transcriptional regulator YheO